MILEFSFHLWTHTHTLTTVGFVGLVGTVWDAVTFWVDLVDAGGGAALEVSTAVHNWMDRSYRMIGHWGHGWVWYLWLSGPYQAAQVQTTHPELRCWVLEDGPGLVPSQWLARWGQTGSHFGRCWNLCGSESSYGVWWRGNKLRVCWSGRSRHPNSRSRPGRTSLEPPHTPEVHQSRPAEEAQLCTLIHLFIVQSFSLFCQFSFLDLIDQVLLLPMPPS